MFFQWASTKLGMTELVILGPSPLGLMVFQWCLLQVPQARLEALLT